MQHVVVVGIPISREDVRGRGEDCKTQQEKLLNQQEKAMERCQALQKLAKDLREFSSLESSLAEAQGRYRAAADRAADDAATPTNRKGSTP